MSLLVKICGLSTPETLEAALAAGADMVGFVAFPPSPRHVAPDAIAQLAGIARGRAEVVILTVDADDATLTELTERARPDWLQLHGRESTDRVAAIKTAFGLPVMKALPIATQADLGPIARYAKAADRLLFDAKAPKDATRPGGLGAAFDWHLLENLETGIPFMVSGGLHAGNVADALRITRAMGVDVSSGVERAPGVKDVAMIRDFIQAARTAEASSPLPASGERSPAHSAGG